MGLSEDAIFEYEIWVYDGVSISKLPCDCEGHGADDMFIRFVLPESAEKLILRPVYANSGAHEEEDVAIELK